MQKKVDPLGRIGIPKYIRKDMGLEENGTVFIDYNFEEKEIFVLLFPMHSAKRSGRNSDYAFKELRKKFDVTIAYLF